MRTFGFEFEHVSAIGHREMANLLQTLKVSVDPYATGEVTCREGCYSGWQVKHDGSITTEDEFQHAIELVSPPLTFKNMEGLVRALRVARQHGKINSSCGLHVHVAAPELKVALDRHQGHLREIIANLWFAVEEIFFSYTVPSRRNNDYCRPGVDWTRKYQGINFSALGQDKGTIEFRLHSGTLNARKAIAFATLCTAFVDKLVEMKPYLTSESVQQKIDTKIYIPPAPKLIKTAKAEVYLHKNRKSWLVEMPKNLLNNSKEYIYPTLQDAFNELKQPLGLRSNNYLAAFQFPEYGNAMGELCKFVGVNNTYNSYLQDRYDNITRTFGYFKNNNNNDSIVDEANYYDEEELADNDPLPVN